MKGSQFTVAASMLTVFLSGLVVGAFGHRIYTSAGVAAGAPAARPDDWRKRFTSEMQTRVKLDANQLGQLNSILDQSRDRYREIRERYRPEMERIRSEETQAVRAMLREDQRPEYEKLLAEREKRMRESKSGGR